VSDIDRAIKRQNIHCLIYGEYCSGKSTFFATWPKPMLIFAFDAMDKLTPYLRLGNSTSVSDPAWKEWYEKMGVEATDVVDDAGKLVCRIEHYDDTDPNDPVAFGQFEVRLTNFASEAKDWASVGIDSYTYCQYASFIRQKKLNPMVMFKQGTDTRQWYAGTKIEMEGILKSRAPRWKTNVGVLCHVKEDKDEFAEGILRGIMAVGTLSKEAPGGFGEVYRVYVEKDGKGVFQRKLQTQSNNLWVAASLVARAPNPCEPDYSALWTGTKEA